MTDKDLILAARPILAEIRHRVAWSDSFKERWREEALQQGWRGWSGYQPAPPADRTSAVQVLNRLVEQIDGGQDVEWENRTLRDYLEALSAWLTDCDGAYRNGGREVPANAWEIICDALHAATAYE
jgi:hypothetical protein